MAEYINREEYCENYCRCSNEYCDRQSCPIWKAPAADVEPVVHGRWEGTADGYADGELVYDMWACSECGFNADGAEEKPEWKYCPNCGAKMDGGGDNAAD